MTNDLPTTGGSWTRDPKTGDLIPNPPPTSPTQEEPAPAAKPKKEA